MTKQQRKTIEREFSRYNFNKKTAENYAAYAVAYDSAAPDGERIKSSYGNRQEQLVIRAIYDQERMRAWCTVFEYTLIKFKREQKDKLMEKLYLEHKDPRRIRYELCLPESTYHYWHNQILLAAFDFAKDFKLL